ncbi:hypothetical protein BGX33_007811 [Mortierella sp. NVP41]|nr:hypothetical protein BGX33_007811 [Mortierella sp. NVP41]
MCNQEPSNIRALKIPEIVLEICKQLTVDELATCLSVSKLWNSIAQHHLWRSVFLYQRTENFFLSLRPEHKVILRQNAHKIRNLGMVQYETVLVGTDCTQLKELYCFGLLDRSKEAESGYPGINSRNGVVEVDKPTALDLIPQNPYLRAIHLIDIELLARWWTPTRLGLLRQHPGLRRINLFFVNHIDNPYIIRTIVNHCPDTLQELRIASFGGVIEQEFEEDEEEEEGEPEGGIRIRSIDCWRPLPQMRDLAIEMCLYPCERTLLFPLLACCPNLERLKLNTAYIVAWDSLMRVLTRQCRLITQLELPNDLPDPSYAIEFMESFRQLRTLTMRVSEGYTKVIEAMLKHSGATLEHLHLVEGSKDHLYLSESTSLQLHLDETNGELIPISHDAVTAAAQQTSGAQVDSILESCGRLQSLKVKAPRGMATTTGNAVEIEQLLKVKWACKDRLESLSFHIDDPRSTDVGGEAVAVGLDNGSSSERNVLLVARLFERLKMLPRLKGLEITWGKMWETIPLETAMRVFQEQGKMTEADVKWMGLLWN